MISGDNYANGRRVIKKFQQLREIDLVGKINNKRSTYTGDAKEGDFYNITITTKETLSYTKFKETKIT